jgi:hypothetical protein
MVKIRQLSDFPFNKLIELVLIQRVSLPNKSLLSNSVFYLKSTSLYLSISPTFYARLFRTKVSRESFVLRFKVCTFLAQKYWRKSRAYNVGEIDSLLPRTLATATYFAQEEEKKSFKAGYPINFTNILRERKFGAQLFLHLHFTFVLFWRKNIGEIRNCFF